MAPSDKPSFLRSLIEWIVIFAIACAAMLALRTFVVEPYRVPTASMDPAIQVDDQIIGEKVSLAMGDPVEQGDIVVFQNPEADSEHAVLVKRVIAVGGQTVDLRYGRVYVDGEPIDEPYAQGSTYPLPVQLGGMDLSFPYTVPEGCIWVMGDNRENSKDSRYFGAVSEDGVIAVAIARYWPLDRVGLL